MKINQCDSDNRVMHKQYSWAVWMEAVFLGDRSRLNVASYRWMNGAFRSQTRALHSIEFHQLLPDPVWSEMLARSGV